MISDSRQQDLIVLVADKNIEYSFRGLLSRPEALDVRRLEWEIVPHPERDPGCRLRAAELLRALRGNYRKALVVFDREGSGGGKSSRQELERGVEESLTADWGENAVAIVMDPELESWFWSVSPHVTKVLGWSQEKGKLRSWLLAKGFLEGSAIKPARPKEAVEAVLRECRKPRSSAIYQQLAEQVSLKGCQDTAFGKFLDTLRRWFPEGREFV